MFCKKKQDNDYDKIKVQDKNQDKSNIIDTTDTTVTQNTTKGNVIYTCVGGAGGLYRRWFHDPIKGSKIFLNPSNYPKSFFGPLIWPKNFEASA